MASESVVNVLPVVRELRAVGQQATQPTCPALQAQPSLHLVPSWARSHAVMQSHALMQRITAQICIKA